LPVPRRRRDLVEDVAAEELGGRVAAGELRQIVEFR
jgi:hypothetical protein